MRTSRLALTITASILAMSSSAFAADSGSDTQSQTTKDDLVAGSGWYVSGSTGLAILEQSTSHGGGSHFDTTADNPGFDVNGALGKELGNGFRAEAEISYRQIGLDHITSYGPPGSGGASGDTSALSLMGNGYYDFDTGGPIKPYVGVGIGGARVSMSNVAVHGNALVNDDDVDFAYQAMAGVGYQVTPQGTLFVGYRYFAVDDPTFNTSVGSRVGSDFASHNIEVGYRIGF
jgi:OmpA-OmpF porin, OOP family